MARLMDCSPAGATQPQDPTLFLPVAIIGFTLVSNGLKFPAIRGSWDNPPDNPLISGVQFEYRNADNETFQSDIQLIERGLWLTTTGVLPGEYQVRYRAVGLDGKVFGDWTPNELIVVPDEFVAGDVTHVGGVPVEDLAEAIAQFDGLFDRLEDVEELSAATALAVIQLEETYGDTASAAASAAAAALSAADAAADAALAQGKAEDAASSAVAASTAAGDALDAASASAANAAVASAKADDASVAANASTAAKVAAETASGAAQTAATQAASSRDDAAGSAASASSSALNAADSRDAAAGSASAAAGSASTATTAAGEAGVSAAAAQASQVSASTARDEALQALMQQGRLNIVARQNRATGTIFEMPAPSSSGWGYRMVGDGGGQERSITVGPLKQNTAYSISFLARRSVGTGPSPLNVDLFPDTLPERVFQIDENWTWFKWEGLSSSHSDMTLPTVRLRFFRVPLASDIAFEITDIKLEEGETVTVWTPSPKDAAASASAAATSASSAAASETAAGISANSSSGSATTATTAAGQAQTYSNQASSSAAAAAGSATTASQASGTAVSARNDAQAAAATAIAQASNASASAASAQISADLAASVSNSSGFNLLKNSTFSDGFTGWNTSTWSLSSLTSPTGPHAFINANGTNNLVSDIFNINASLKYTLSADFRAQGTGGSVVSDVQWLNSSGGHVAYSNRILARTVDYVNFDQPRKSVTVTPPSGATQARVRVYTENVTGIATNGAAVRQIKLEVGDKATTWRDDSQLVALNSSLNITASTTADLATRMATARFEVTAAAGGNPAQLKIRADSTGSLAALVAQAVSFSNTISGTVVEVMRIIGGDVFITGKLFIGTAKQITFDPAIPALVFTPSGGTVKMLYGAGFGSGSNCTMWFGPTSVANGSITRTNGYWAFGTDGKVYYGNAELPGGGGGDSALRSTIGGNPAAGTAGTTWVNAGSCAFSNLPTGGTLKLFASASANNGMTIDGSGIGSSLNGEARVIQNSVVLATGSLLASVAGGDASATIFIPNQPVAPAQTGATTLTLQVRSTTTGRNVGGAGMTTQIYAEWTKNG